MGRLSTHVLDTAHGQPAAGVSVTLHRITGEHRILLAKTITNHDGRTDALLMAGLAFAVGTYEICFAVGGYFRDLDPTGGTFLDIVPVRFTITEPDGHYHVPLLVTPWSYATYRGS